MSGVGVGAVAVVGAACRLPGGIADLEALWASLDTGAVRAQDAPAGFDAGYFGMSAQEAARLSPEDALLLELTVEALDDAGLDGTGAGVYAGGAGHHAAARHLGGPGRSCPSPPAAVEQACRALHAGDVRLALAADVSGPPPGPAGGPALPSGAVVVLKRLGDALAGRDRVHGVLAGWGGEHEICELYERARVDPGDLVYVETGDHEAIARALAPRRAHPLPVSTGRDGILAVIKAMLVLRHRRTPRHRDDTLLPVPGGARVEPVAPGTAAQGFVGIGDRGTHVIVAPAPADLGRVVRQCGPLPVTVSARSRQALGEAVHRMAGRLRAATQEEFYDLAYTSCARRTRHPYRRVVLANTPQAAAGALVEGVRLAVRDGRVAFAYGGGIGGALPFGDRVFRSAVDRVDALLAPRLGRSLRDQTAGPALVFAAQVGVTRMLAVRGIRPATAFGEGHGRLAAAWASGRMTLEEAVRALTQRTDACPVSCDPGACPRCRSGPPGAGAGLFVEVGPGLGAAIRRGALWPPLVVTTLGEDGDGVEPAARELIEAGADADWDAVFPRPGRVVGLPAYPWQRRIMPALARRSDHAG